MIGVHVTNLQSINTANIKEGLFIPLILGKLPEKIAVQWKRLEGSEEAKIQEFLRFLNEECKSSEAAGSTRTNVITRSCTQNLTSNRKPAISALPTLTSNQNKKSLRLYTEKVISWPCIFFAKLRHIPRDSLETPFRGEPYREPCTITTEALEIDFICQPVPATNASLTFQLQQKGCWLAENRCLKQFREIQKFSF